MSLRRSLLAALCGVIAWALAPAGLHAAPPPAPPAWLLEAAARPTPETAAGAPILVLLDEWAYDVQPDGRVLHTRRYAMRVLSRSGSDQARASVAYLDKRDIVTATTAWLVRAGKVVTPPKKREWADVSAASDGAIYDESRSRAISYGDLAFEGDVFACETKVERRLLFGQLVNYWRCWMPTLVDRFVLRLPPGWACEVVTEGQELGLLKETVAGTTRTWEMCDRPYRPDEPAVAEGARRDAIVRINLVPPSEAKDPMPFVPRDWAAVARWDWNISRSQCDTNPALAAEVQQLTAGCADKLARVRALSRHVQQLRYVGVNKDLALGSGYKPRKATEVHAKGWGDCKDKANLLIAMLREVGVEAFIVTVQAGGGRLVNPAWPSLQQFNHAIVGLRVDESETLPSVAEAPGVGRLLFFDATDSNVLLGDLPTNLQGALVYVVAPETTGLVALPVPPTDPAHLFETRLMLVLAADGAVTGECEVGGTGQAGAVCRAKERRSSAKDLRIGLNEWINGAVRGAQVKDVTSTDDPVSGDHRIKFGFAAPTFGQPMPGGLRLLRLDVLSRDSVPAFPEKKRRLAVGLPPIMHRDEVKLELPPGFVVDELPTRTELRSIYGTYANAVEVAGQVVTVRRELRLEDRTVPLAEYPALRQFMTDVAKADRASLVIRQGETGGAAPAP